MTLGEYYPQYTYSKPYLIIRARMAHGLSSEGVAMTKNFLLEFAFIATGYLTFVTEVQEICSFCCIGLIADFYMQVS